MKKLPVLIAVLFAVPAFAADYKCNGERVEKGGSTQYVVKVSGGDYTVEKGGSTKGKAVKRNSKLYVEVGGSTVATIENGKIEKGGSSWATVGDAQRIYDCPGDIAATLWVLNKAGKL